MAQARREPRFSEIEVLPPAQVERNAGLSSFDLPDVSDAVFETLPVQASEEPARKPLRSVRQEPSVSGLGLLKHQAGAHVLSESARAGITPGFAAFTILLAFAVFWLCGGHVLLY
jgi:hypothetical protein